MQIAPGVTARERDVVKRGPKIVSKTSQFVDFVAGLQMFHGISLTVK